MLKNISKNINELKGTASELFENRAFDDLKELVGEDGALRAIDKKLQERNLTPEKWEIYREVRSVMHANPMGIGSILKEVNELSEGCLA